MASTKVRNVLRTAIQALYGERDRLNTTISVLEAVGQVSRSPGRPRKAAITTTTEERRKPGRPAKKTTNKAGRSTGGWSAAKRKAVADRMRKYWAERRKSAKKARK